ncbi:MAG: hypothetical protein WAX44_00780 [Minisyncoccia bacterium]
MSFELHTIENPSSRDDQGHLSRKLEKINPGRDRVEAFRVARERILGNPDLYEKFIKGFIKSSDSIPVELASVQNEFLSNCVELSDQEIDSLVRQFNKGLADYLIKNYAKLGIDSQRKEHLLSSLDSLGMNSVGIISAVEYIRSRKKLFELGPEQDYGFYFEDSLDARYKIDLIEVLYLDGKVNSMNLVQIKSRKPDDNEIEKILDDHRSWVASSMMDLETFEREYTDGIPDNLTIEIMLENAQDVEDLLVDVCTDPDGFKPDKFIEKLDLGNLNNKQKAWLLLKYGKIMIEKIASAVKNQVLDANQAEEILGALSKLTNKVIAKAKLPKNFSTVRNINSVIAVGPEIIREERIHGDSISDIHKKVVGLSN